VILVMTSNLGATFIMERSRRLTEQNSDRIFGEIKDEVDRLLKQTLRPEFLNRIDEVIVFHPLTVEELQKIVDIQFRKIQERAEKQGLALNLDAAAREFLARTGYDPAFGARPLKRLLQREISDPLASGILGGRFQKNDAVRIRMRENSLDFEVKKN
jgi:ATP-dependent Clp protease ATP-binding subunit ClpB